MEVSFHLFAITAQQTRVLMENWVVQVRYILNNWGYLFFLVFDYVHIFKNVRNNWITVGNQMLSFVKDGKTYVAYWGDVRALYEENRNTTQRLTKLTHTAVFPKLLQKQKCTLSLPGF